jgi:hypothetical protein
MYLRRQAFLGQSEEGCSKLLRNTMCWKACIFTNTVVINSAMEINFFPEHINCVFCTNITIRREFFLQQNLPNDYCGRETVGFLWDRE